MDGKIGDGTGDPWGSFKPGDLATVSGSMIVTWPPDGARKWVDDKFNFDRPLEITNLKDGESVVIVSVSNASWSWVGSQHGSTDLIVFTQGRFWWARKMRHC